jgi:hypothetical protein
VADSARLPHPADQLRLVRPQALSGMLVNLTERARGRVTGPGTTVPYDPRNVLVTLRGFLVFALNHLPHRGAWP